MAEVTETTLGRNTTPSSCIQPGPSDLDALDQLMEAGRYQDAYQQSLRFGSLKDWRGPRSREIASAIANQSGGYRLSDAIDVQAYREHRDDIDIQLSYLHYLRIRRSPLDAWELLNRLNHDHATPKQQIRRLFHLANIVTEFRDFVQARSYLDQAARLNPPPHKLLVEESELARAQDHYEQALDFARKALAAKPYHVPALREMAANLVDLGRNAEAISLLQDSLQHVQSLALLWRLIELQWEEDRHAETIPLLERYQTWSPLCEKSQRNWAIGRLADAHYYLGQIDKAITYAEQRSDDYYRDFAKRLRDPQRSQIRKELPLGYIRQHHNTCGATTLANLSAYWGQPIPHEKVVEAIWYDGTSDPKERIWSEQQGFVVREFKYTWEIARQLIDRGIPFALATSYATSSHLQAVSGYDEARQTILIRDPSDATNREYITDAIATTYAATGPRCLLMLPNDQTDKLSGLDLPESEGFDLLHQVRHALDLNNRDLALTIQAKLDALLPGHRLALFGQYSIACHDRNLFWQNQCTEKLLALFPDNSRLQLQYLASLRDLGREQERHDWLEKKLTEKERHPLLFKEYAIDLSGNALQHQEAQRLLRRAHRYLNREASVLGHLARLYRSQRKLEESCTLYRFACGLDISNESLADNYFSVSRQADHVEPALDLLRQRFALLGDKDCGPGKTLFKCLEALERTSEAFTVLEKALTRRPKDEWLLLFAANTYSRYNQHERAHRLLDQAEPTAPRNYLYFVKASMAENERQWEQAVEWWRKQLELEPDSEIAHSSIAELLSKLHGRSAAIEFLDQSARQLPHNLEIQTNRYRWYRTDPKQAESILREIIAIHPQNIWTRIELIRWLRQREALDEALDLAKETVALDPCWTYSVNALAEVHKARGETLQARDTFRRVLRLDIDATFAMDSLVTLARTTADKLTEIDFVLAELRSQTVWGDGYFALQNNAQNLLEPDKLLAIFETARSERPDFWQRWAVTIDQLANMRQLEPARQLAQQAVERFPLLPAVHLRLAKVLKAMGRDVESIVSLQRALDINPFWTSPVYELCDIYRQKNQFDEFRTTIESALVRNPREARFLGFLAEAISKLETPSSALPHLIQSLELDPDYSWGWDRLIEWCPEREILRHAKAIAEQNPANIYSWMGLARVHRKMGHLDDCLACLDRALQLRPRDALIHDQKACALAEASRLDEALLACSPSIYGNEVPGSLMARAAWIQSQKGDRSAAIGQMRKALEVDPANSWAWTRLADWLHEAKEYESELQAIEHMRRLEPNEAVPLGYRAEAKLALKDRAGAKADLREACRMDSNYSFAWNTLLRLLREDNELEEVEKVVVELEKIAPGNSTLRHRALYHICKRESVPALATIEKLCFSPISDTYLIEEVAQAYKEAGASADIERIFHEAITRSTPEKPVNPNVGHLWVASWSRRREWREESQLNQLDIQSPAGHNALIAYIEALGESSRIWKLRWLQFRLRRLFASNTSAWGTMGYALSIAQKNIETVIWMRGWRAKPDLRPWMLSNLALSWGRLKIDRAVTRVVDYALSLPPDHVHGHLLSWKAIISAVNLQHDDARKALNALADKDTTELYKFLRQLAQWIEKVHDAPPSERKAVFDAERSEIESLRVQNPNLRTGPISKRFWILATRRAAKLSHRWLAYARTFLPHIENPVESKPGLSAAFVRILGGILFLSALRSCSPY